MVVERGIAIRLGMRLLPASGTGEIQEHHITLYLLELLEQDRAPVLPVQDMWFAISIEIRVGFDKTVRQQVIGHDRKGR